MTNPSPPRPLRSAPRGRRRAAAAVGVTVAAALLLTIVVGTRPDPPTPMGSAPLEQPGSGGKAAEPVGDAPTEPAVQSLRRSGQNDDGV